MQFYFVTLNIHYSRIFFILVTSTIFISVLYDLIAHASKALFVTKL